MWKYFLTSLFSIYMRNGALRGVPKQGLPARKLGLAIQIELGMAEFPLGKAANGIA